MSLMSFKLRRVSRVFPPENRIISSRIEDGMIVSLGRPYLAAAVELTGASGGLLTVFFGMGDDTFGGDDGAGAGGDDGAVFLRGMDAYGVAGVGATVSCFTATGTTGDSSFGVSGVEIGSVLMAATIDFVIWDGDFLDSSSGLAFSSSLSANKSSSSSLSAGGAVASFTSLDMLNEIGLFVL